MAFLNIAGIMPQKDAPVPTDGGQPTRQPTKNFGKKLLILGIAAIVLAGAGLTLTLMQQKKDNPATQPITLTYWGVFDSPTTLEPIIADYQKEHPNVTIKYEQKSFDHYEQDLKNAILEKRGPDIISLPNTWIPRFAFLLAPEPSGNQHITDDYFDVVAKDAEIDQKLYGLPYSVDSLALFINKSVFKEASITTPPTTWDAFNDIVRKATKLGPHGEILRSGAALGTSSKTINRATDILNFFMIQDGVPMTDAAHTTAQFVEVSKSLDASGKPVDAGVGLAAVNRYLSYSKPTEPVYTWNEVGDYSFDAFTQGKVAMIFSYAYGENTVRQLNPKLDFEVVPAPQYPNAITKVAYANYWLETVSKDSANSATAWDFVRFATNQDHVRIYSQRTGKPASRRDLVNEQLNNPDLAAFIEQAPYATSWYQYQPQQVEVLFDQFLTDMVQGKAELKTALTKLQGDVTEILSTGAAEIESRKKLETQKALQQEQDQKNAQTK